MSPTALAFILLLASVLLHVSRRLNAWLYDPKFASPQSKLPPGDLGWPIFGSMPRFLRCFKHSGDPESFIRSYISKYRRVAVYTTHLFGRPCIMAVTPESCKLVLTNDHLFQTAWPHSTRTLMGYKSFAGPISEAEHHHLRRLTAPFVNGPEALAQYVPLIESIVTRSLRDWARRGRVNLLREMRKLTFDVISHICIRYENWSMRDEIEKLYADVNLAIRSMGINFPGTAYHRALKSRRRLVAILQKVVDDRKAKSFLHGSEDQDMLHALMHVEDENGKRISDEQIIDLLIMYLNAGHESTAHASLWLLIFLSRNPEILMKAKQEQHEIRMAKASESVPLNIQDWRSMKYLSKVITETLRIVNISPLVFRRALCDVEIDGYTIPKGWSTQTWMRQVHLDPEVYPEPTKFDPDRWDGFVPRTGQFIPFGAGSRFCPGNELAKLEMSVFMHHVLLFYEIEALNPHSKTIYLPHPRPQDGFEAFVTERTYTPQ